MKSQAILLSPTRDDEQQARARDLRRRRRLRPWRDGRRARSRAAVLSAGARPAAGRGRGDAARGVRRRRDRPRRRRQDSPRRCASDARMARGRASERRRHEPIVRSPPTAPYDVEAIRADFPILAERPYGKPLVYLDNAASAQKPRAVIERLDACLRARIRQRPSRPALSRQCRDRRLRGGARERAPLPQRRLDRRDRLHALGDRGDQSRRRELRARTTSARATRSCFR